MNADIKKEFVVTGIIFVILGTLAIIFFVYFFLQIGNSDETRITANAVLEPEILASNLVAPWSLDFIDEKIIFTERDGKINIIEGGEVRNIGEINVNNIGEGGLLGIAVDPDFNNNHFIYVYYTSEDDNRVSRFIFNEDTNELTGETIILEGIPFSSIHNGGRIKFGPDDKLYIATGDASNPKLSQDVNSLAGKILRINKDGTIPDDNPFGNAVWTYGHRNPQGLAWDDSGRMFSSEHGPSGRDEINIIEKGNNYGWPMTCDEEGNYSNPIRCYTEFTLAPSGIEFHENVLFIAGLRGNQLREIVLDNGNIVEEIELLSELGRIRDVVAKEGFLYIATSNRDGRGLPRPGDDIIFRINTDSL